MKLPANNSHPPVLMKPSPAPTPRYDWYIDGMRFREARVYAAEKGNYSPGAMRTRIAQLDCGLTRHPAIQTWPEKDRALGLDLLGRRKPPRLDRVEPPKMLSSAPEAPGSWTTQDFVGPLGTNRPIPPLIWPNHGTSTAYMILGDPSVRQQCGAPAPGGVLPDANLIPYRISRSIISINGGNFLDAIEDAIVQDCSVITVSHLVAFRPGKVDKAITKAYEAGVIVCAAAGSHVFPLRHSMSRIATSPMAVGVGACLSDDSPWHLTHASPALDILAPGFNMVSPYTRHDIWTGKATYEFFVSEGTSYSTPLAAAAAALWVEHHGDALDRYSEKWMRVEAFQYCLQHSARPVQNIEEKDRHLYGAGILDALRLLQIPLPPERILRRSNVRPDHARDQAKKYVIWGDKGNVVSANAKAV